MLKDIEHAGHMITFFRGEPVKSATSSGLQQPTRIICYTVEKSSSVVYNTTPKAVEGGHFNWLWSSVSVMELMMFQSITFKVSRNFIQLRIYKFIIIIIIYKIDMNKGILLTIFCFI